MEDLKHGDVFLPPDPDTTSSLKVVPVHNDMYSQIECDWNPGHGSETNELSVSEQSGCPVVIGMEESQRLLLEDKEDGVEEFEEFSQVVQLRGSATASDHRLTVHT